MGNCGTKNKIMNDNNKLNPPINNKKINEFAQVKKNNDFFYNYKNKNKIFLTNQNFDLNINQKGDINNYIDVKQFEEFQ